MNIFATHSDPVICAQEYCRVHNTKMILELSQMLSTAHRLKNGSQEVYKAAYINHPCTKWVRENVSNYIWTFDHLMELHEMFFADRGKHHASYRLMEHFLEIPKDIKDGQITQHPQCMPDEYKDKSSYEAYKKYLNAKFEDWIRRRIDVSFFKGIPDWYRR